MVTAGSRLHELMLRMPMVLIVLRPEAKQSATSLPRGKQWSASKLPGVAQIAKSKVAVPSNLNRGFSAGGDRGRLVRRGRRPNQAVKRSPSDKAWS